MYLCVTLVAVRPLPLQIVVVESVLMRYILFVFLRIEFLIRLLLFVLLFDYSIIANL